MIVAWRDAIAAATLTASAQVADKPAQNAQVNPVALPWIVPGSSGHVDVDAGAAVEWRVFAALGTNLTPGATVRLQLSNAAAGDGGVHDTGVVSAGVLPGYPQVYLLLDQALSARYVRLSFADAALPELRIGRLFGGPAWAPARNRSYGDAIRWEDPSLRDRSQGGQLLMGRRRKHRVLSFQLEFNSKAEMMANAFELDREAGLTEDVLVMLDPAGYRQQESVFGPLTRSTELAHWTFQRQRKLFEIEERL
jgi:hypothetical protein